VLLRVGQNTYNLLLMPRCSSFLVLILVFAASLAPLSARGSRQQFGKIKGQVVDINDARILRAEVVIAGGGLRWRLTTNDAGEFETSLPTGEYQFSVEADGFQRFSSQRIEIKSGKTQRFNIKMKMAQPINLIPVKSDSQTD
jgi:hypothetical protein